MQTRIITLSYSKVRETMLFFRKGFVEFSRAIFWFSDFLTLDGDKVKHIVPQNKDGNIVNTIAFTR